MKTKYILSSLLLGALMLTGCTNLDEDLYDKVLVDDYGKTDSEVGTIVGGAYATLRGYGASTPEGNGTNCYPTCEYVFFALECASDEACIPTRGNDWNDGGRYLRWQQHTWDANDPGPLSLWRYAFTGVSKVNAIIAQIQDTNISEEAKTKCVAELRALRAYYYTLLIDEFGNVPITTDVRATELPANSPRRDVFEFVESELTDALPYLASGVIYGRMTQNVANALLARMYLNAAVYLNLDLGSDAYKVYLQRCLDACAKVQGYALTGDYSASFAIANEKSPEIIMAIPYDHTMGTVGNYLASMTYHYNQNQAFSADASYPWCGNGICAQPGVYSSYEDGDVRRDKSLLVGQQYKAKDGSPILDDDGSPINYVEEIEDFSHASRVAGARLNKYEWSPSDQWERDNDWVLMRYAEVLMMQAEANFRLGNAAAAMTYMNHVRARAGLPALTAVDEKALDNEWLHEFAFEGLRRTVNIRFGTFFESWWFKDADAADHHTGIYPIPAEEMDKNKNLVQNPGY